MTGGIKFKFVARTMHEAVDTALERWRLWVDDPEAELPWSTHYEVKEEKRADDGSELEVECYIEFDRNQLEKGLASSE